jgi:hypothetical protein
LKLGPALTLSHNPIFEMASSLKRKAKSNSRRGCKMKQILIKTIKLGNGLKLEFYDISRKLAGDRWYVGVIARINITLIDSLPTNQHLSHYSVEEIRNALGESVRFQQILERHYIDEREKDDLLNSLMDSFIKRTLKYLSLRDFPGKYVLKEFRAYRKRKTWHQNV